MQAINERPQMRKYFKSKELARHRTVRLLRAAAPPARPAAACRNGQSSSRAMGQAPLALTMRYSLIMRRRAHSFFRRDGGSVHGTPGKDCGGATTFLLL